MENLFLVWNIGSFCTEAADVLSLVGWILTVFKIAIPLIIVAYGMFDFGKAVTASKDDEIKKSAKTLGMRALAGVIIFFVPTIVMWIFGLVPSYSDDAANFSVCEDCILRPGSDDCTKYIKD